MTSPLRNVLLIVVDQWRGDVLRAAGHSSIRTRNIDRLCAEGVTFRRHFSQTAPCGPARASLLTGMYAMNHRAVQNSTPLDSKFTNIAFEMRKGGYDPALIGYTTTTPDPARTHPNDPRFKVLGDDMEGWRPVGTFSPSHEPYFGFLREAGFPVPAENGDDVWLPPEGVAPGTGATAAPTRFTKELSDTTWFTDLGLRYLRGLRRRSWFLHLGYYRPHPPFIAPEPYNSMYDPVEVPPPVRAASAMAEAAQHPLLDYYIRNVPRGMFFQGGAGLGSEMSEAEVRQMRATYHGLISEIDDQLGRVFQYLKDAGMWDDTLIVFTSDHGEQLGDHHLLGKIGYFDQSFHIPLVIRDPRPQADAARGRLIDDFTGSIDVMPTILDWVGLDVPRQCDGFSLLPFVLGERPADWRREIQYEFDFRDVKHEKTQKALGIAMDECGLAAIQDEKYKYVHFAALPPLFFDLHDDPHQFVDRADDPAYQGRVLEYAQKMLSWRLRFADKRLTGFSTGPDGLIERRG